MASINIGQKEVVKLINYFLAENEVEEIKDIRVDDDKIKFKYNPGKLLPNIPLSIRIDSFKSRKLILEMKEHTIVPIGNQILKVLNSFIENLINSWLFDPEEDTSDKVCNVKNNFINISIDSIERKFFGEYPLRINDIAITDGEIELKFKI